MVDTGSGNPEPVDPRRGLRVAFGAMAQEYLVVRGAREHNLKNISVAIPRNRLTVITGLSGSGKSSLAFDTIYAEGQRRYVESLSAYARQFLGLMEKPDVDAIEGLSPAISIEQKTTGQNPRSTVGTVTEIYDYLRLLWARVGVPHCPNDGTPGHAAERGADHRHRSSPGRRRPGSRCSRRSCAGARASSATCSRTCGSAASCACGWTARPTISATVPPLNRRQNHDISVVVDRLVVRRGGPLAAQRFDRDGAQDRRTASSRSCARQGGSQSVVVFSERFACPGLRPLAARARAAPVLVQLAVRRLSRLPRPRHPPRGERRAGARRPQHLHPRGRDPALGRADRLPPQGRAARRSPRRSSSTSTRRGASTARAPGTRSSTARRARSASRPRAPGAGASSRASGKACSATSSGATASPAATRCGSRSRSS